MIEVHKEYIIEILEHPKEGAQEWLGNTQHMFTELLEEFGLHFESYKEAEHELELWVDRAGDRSPTGTYYWATPKAFNSFGSHVKLYGPVKARVTLKDAKSVYTHGFWIEGLGDTESVRQH